MPVSSFLTIPIHSFKLMDVSIRFSFLSFVLPQKAVKVQLLLWKSVRSQNSLNLTLYPAKARLGVIKPMARATRKTPELENSIMVGRTSCEGVLGLLDSVIVVVVCPAVSDVVKNKEACCPEK